MDYTYKKCINCAFFCPNGSVYECRLNPPVAYIDDGGEQYTTFPDVKSDWWCGQFSDGVDSR